MPTGLIHAAITCATNGAGQAHCSGAGGLLAGLLVVYLVIAVVGIIAAVKVVTKAGYSGWWVLITFVPLVGIVFVLIFAFSKWPVLQEVEMLRSHQTGGYYGGPGAYGRPGGYAQPGPYSPPGGYGPSPGFAGSAPTAPTPGPGDPGGSAPEPVDLPTFGQFIEGGSMSGAPVARTPAADPVGSLPLPPAGAPTADAPGSAPLPPAGWFPAPGGRPGQLRYWDGSNWTDHFNS
jgi:Protein of unknown function (DUF2510)